jgi:hypothetical protein
VRIATVVPAFAWILLVVFSFFGWGIILCRLLRMRCDAGETACLSLSIATAAGGILNCLTLALPFVNVGFVLPGAAIGILHASRSSLKRVVIAGDPWIWVLLAIVIPLMTFYIASYSYNFEYEKLDDLLAYMVFPAKMLTGSLGFEPFSERRLITSLGGLYYLQSILLTGADFHWLHVIDPAFALLSLVLLTNGAMRARGASLRSRCLVNLFLLLFPPIVANLSPGLLQTPLLVFLYLIAEEPRWIQGRTASQRSICLGLTSAAIIAVKPLGVPFLGFLLAGTYSSRVVWGPNRLAHAIESLGTALLTICLLLPWMVSNRRQTGTLVYPLFGTGYSTANFVSNVMPLWQESPLSERLTLFVTKGLLNVPVLLLLGLYVIFCTAVLRSDHRERRAAVLAPGLCVAGVLAIVLSMCLGGAGGAGLVRYSYPFALAGVVILLYNMVSLLQDRKVTCRYMYYSGLLTVLICSIAILANARNLDLYYSHGLMNFRIAYSGPNQRLLDSYNVLRSDQAESVIAIHRLQESVPPGENILERLDYPFVMDFRRNNVFVADWPGSTGPPPGWPLSQGPRRLATYLNEVFVHYIAFTYTKDALLYIEGDISSWDAWIQTDLKRTIEFQNNLSEMMRVCPLAFKDSRRVVIHLTLACIDALPDVAD